MPATGRFSGTPASISASELPQTVAVAGCEVVGVQSGDRFDAADAGGDGAFSNDAEESDLTGAAHVRAGAEFHRVAVQRVRLSADLHDTHHRRLVDKTPNHTFYQFGYLYMADTLCYWQRELDQAGTILGTGVRWTGC